VGLEEGKQEVWKQSLSSVGSARGTRLGFATSRIEFSRFERLALLGV